MAIGINVTRTNNNQKFALELSSHILNFDISNFDYNSAAAKTLTVTTPSDGKLYTYVENPNIITASITDKSIKITPCCHATAIRY